MVGSSLRLAMAVLPPAPVLLLPVSAGTGWNALISMAKLFSPMPRNPPTPTISPRILPFLSNSMSLTLPMCALSGPSTSVPLNLEKTHWSVLCAAMNFAVSCGAASVFAAGAAGAAGFGDISACARAPETISALIAAEIISVLSICGLRSCLFRQGKEAFLAREQLASTVMRSVHWEPGGGCCEGGFRTANPLDGAAPETERDGASRVGRPGR